MKSNRPKLKVPLEALDKITDMISITLLILLIVYTAISYSELSDIIPIHFNAQGEANDFGKKTFVWLLPCISAFMFGLLFFLNKFPHLHNYKVNITEENALKNYKFSTRLVRFINLFIIILFAFIQYILIQNGKGVHMSLGSWFLPIVIGFSIVLPLFLFIYNRKINKS